MNEPMLYKVDGFHYRKVTWEDLPKCETCEYAERFIDQEGDELMNCNNYGSPTTHGMVYYFDASFGCNRHSDYYKR